MERFQRFDNYARVALASIVSAMALLLMDTFTKILGNETLGGLAVVAVVSLLALIGNAILELAVDRSVRIRHWIARDDFIEGWWYDVAKEPQAETETHAALQRITYRDGTFHVSGASFLSTGKRLASWSSVACSYGGRTLYVVYDAQTDLVRESFERGIVQVKFDIPPTSYSGKLNDFSGRVVRTLRGELVKKEDLAQFNYFHDADDRMRFLQATVPSWRAHLHERRASGS